MPRITPQDEAIADRRERKAAMQADKLERMQTDYIHVQGDGEKSAPVILRSRLIISALPGQAGKLFVGKKGIAREMVPRQWLG